MSSSIQAFWVVGELAMVVVGNKERCQQGAARVAGLFCPVLLRPSATSTQPQYLFVANRSEVTGTPKKKGNQEELECASDFVQRPSFIPEGPYKLLGLDAA